MSISARLTAEQLRDLERSDACLTPVLSQLLAEFKLQRQVLETFTQYIQMFDEGDGKAPDVAALISDLRDALDTARPAGNASNVVPLPDNRRIQCPHCSASFVTAR